MKKIKAITFIYFIFHFLIFLANNLKKVERAEKL